MLFFPAVFAIVMLGFGCAAISVNHRRPTNQVLAGICFLGAIMFGAQLVARHHGAQYLVDGVSDPMPWVRLRFAAIGLLCPMMVWLCYYVVSGRYKGRLDLFARMAPAIFISVLLVAVSYSEAFKSSASRPDNIQNGPLYPVYFAVMFCSQLVLCIASLCIERRLTGIRRLEFRFITIPFGHLGLAALAASLLDVLWNGHQPVVLAVARTLSTLVFPAFAIGAWSVTSRRIYSSTQVLGPLLQQVALFGCVATVAALALSSIPHNNHSVAITATVIAVTCGVTFLLQERVRDRWHRDWQARAERIAHEIQTVARAEAEPDRALVHYAQVLGSFAEAKTVRILRLNADRYTDDHLSVPAPFVQHLIQTGGSVSLFALERRHADESLRSMVDLLATHEIQLLVSPPTLDLPALIIAFGERQTGVPYTHPEVESFRRLAEMVNALYTKARFALQARQAEQLATIGLVGAGLAHELRNPLEAIQTFAELLPERIRDRQFLQEFCEVIPGEAQRVRRLCEQLLDMAKPRDYTFTQVDLAPIAQAAISLLRNQAAKSRVSIRLETAADKTVVSADRHAIHQVCLNLLLNAIQAIGTTGRPGTVAVRLIQDSDSVAIEIRDDGPGIPEAQLGTLFSPFATGGKEGGLGLGLTVCDQIARVHHATLTASNQPGGGACFTFRLPRCWESSPPPNDSTPSHPFAGETDALDTTSSAFLTPQSPSHP